MKPLILAADGQQDHEGLLRELFPSAKYEPLHHCSFGLSRQTAAAHKAFFHGGDLYTSGG